MKLIEIGIHLITCSPGKRNILQFNALCLRQNFLLVQSFLFGSLTTKCNAFVPKLLNLNFRFRITGASVVHIF